MIREIIELKDPGAANSVERKIVDSLMFKSTLLYLQIIF